MKIRYYIIADFYLSAIFNRDRTGLNETDIKELDAFLEYLPPGHFDSDYTESGYGECCICNLMANCVDLKYILED